MTIQVHRSGSGCSISFTGPIVDPAMRELALLDAPLCVAALGNLGVAMRGHAAVSNQLWFRSTCSKKVLASSALADPAMPAMTESATRADRMVFMAISSD